MKCTIRQVPEGIIATVDERPEIGDWYINIAFKTSIRYYKSSNDYQHFEHKIIASTFGVEKELWINADSKRNLQVYSSRINIGDVKMSSKVNYSDDFFNKEYEYTETETQVIIQL